MKNKQSLRNVLGCAVLSSFSAICVAQDFETWTETMTCGEAKYKLESVCKKAKEEYTLNECKSQTLEITNKVDVRKINLPELSKFSLQIYKKVGGKLKELSAIQWGCGQSDSGNVMVIYYSIGGGSAAYSESFSYYDNQGSLIEDEKNKKYSKAIDDGDNRMKNIRSIMPD